MAKDGVGTTITFGTTGFSANIIDVAGPNQERGSIDATHLGSTDYMDFIPAELVDGGSVDITIEYAVADNPPIDQPAETITIDPGGDGDTVSFSGFMTNHNPSMSVGERMTATCTIKVAGTVTES
jgi:hypothetical protein